MECPQCRESFDGRQQCPRCGAGLLISSSFQKSAKRPSRWGDEDWHKTPGGRLLVAVAVAIGLSYGLLQTALAGLRAFGWTSPEEAFGPLAGVLLFQGLQAVALVAGGVLAGVGQKRGIVFGAFVGVVSGLLLIGGMLSGVVAGLVGSFAADLLTPGHPIRNFTLYALPVLHAVFGAVGGWIGSFVWGPPLEPEAGVAPGLRKLSARVRHRWKSRKPFFSLEGPVAWFRVLAGSAVAVAGAFWTNSIVHFILQLSEGKMTIATQLEDQVAYGEIFVLSILIGGCIAGMCQRNGFKQGLCVGLIAAFLVAGLFWKGSVSGTFFYPVISVLFLGPVGGWFGGELLPPVVRTPRRRRDVWLRVGSE